MIIIITTNNNNNNKKKKNPVKQCNQPDWLIEETREAIHIRNLFKKVASFSEYKLWRNN